MNNGENKGNLYEFPLVCNLRSRSSIAFKNQKNKKSKKTFDLLGYSHSFLQKWIINQLYGNMFPKLWFSSRD